MELTQKVKNIQEKWDANFMKTYAQIPVVMDKGEGATITDIDGKKYVDFTSGIGVSSLGYGHKGLVEAIQYQAAKLLHSSNIFFNQPHVEAGAKLIALSGYDKVFFCNSGTEANEGAMKIARKYSDLKYGGDRGTILSLNKSFHGRTMASLMATGKEAYHKYFYPLPTGYKYVEKNDIEAFKEALKDETICAFIFEAVQGEGGVYPIDKDFIEEAVKLCQEKDIVVICDEVQAGMGRTGKLFGFQEFDIKPDLVTMAKGLAGGIPVGGILADEKVSDVLVDKVAKIGEKLSIRRFVRFETTDGLIEKYIHGDGKIAVLVNVKNGDNVLAKDICMQIAAAKPEFLNREAVPQERLDKEMEILKVQAMNEGKPEAIAEKIVQGRIGKFYSEICLVEQPFVKDPDMKIADLLKTKNAEIVEFARIEKGEGIEKKEENFAEEVMKQIK